MLWFHCVNKNEVTDSNGDQKKLFNIIKTACSSDLFPTKLLMSHLPTIIDTLIHNINLCLSTSVFPSSCKSAVVLPLIKKPGLDPQVFKNYRPVSNLYSFV